MTVPIISTFAYGILTLIGGIMGYIKVKSKPSLISGVISGLLLIFATILQYQGIPWSLTLAQLVTGILILVFLLRLIKTQKFMPAGLMLIAGIAAMVGLFI